MKRYILLPALLLASAFASAQTTVVDRVTRHTGAGTGMVLQTYRGASAVADCQRDATAPAMCKLWLVPAPPPAPVVCPPAPAASTSSTSQACPAGTTGGPIVTTLTDTYAVGAPDACLVTSVRTSATTGTCTPGAPPSSGAPKATLTATRLSGPAPLAVLFDASASTIDVPTILPVHQLIYRFDFGDDRGQAWSQTGLPKNVQSGGPIAAHVFDQPGVYTVRVRATSPAGQVGEATATITVTDPATVYAGTQTVCVSSSDFAGCPAGAAQQAAIPPLSGKRVLLRRGGTFGAINPANTDTGFQVGAFGVGAKPIVAGVSTGMRGGVASWTSDWVVMDLDVGSVNIDATTTRFLLYRNDIKRPSADAMVNIGTAATYYQSNGSGAVPGSMPWPREVFLVENDIQGVVQGSARPNLVVMGYFLKSALLGNTIDRATEHSLRIWAASRTQISHNLIGGNHYAPTPPGIRGAVKIHSGGAQPFADLIAGSPTPASSMLILSNNIIGSTTYPGSFLSGFGPQNADRGTVEGLEDCIAENNVYVRGPYTVSEMQIRGRRMTARGNTVQGGGKPDMRRIDANFDPGMAAWDGPYFLQ